MKPYYWLIAILCLAGLLVGCSSQKKASQPSPEGTNWKLETMNGNPILSGTLVTISFGQTNQIVGSDGCNQYIGTYAVKDNLLTLFPSGITKVTCPPPVATQENDYLTMLQSTSTYVQENGRLELIDTRGKLLATFILLSPTSLTDTQWKVASYNNGQQVIASAGAGSEITALFSTDGNLTGYDGCNTYKAAYKVDGDKIGIQPATTTEKTCAQALMDQEAQYLKAIQGAVSFTVSESTLEMRGTNGALIASFKK